MVQAPQAQLREAAEDLVLWDVVEEHLDEAAFGCDELERSFDHPVLTLEDVRGDIERRLEAHVDALVIGDVPVAERLLVPAIVDGDESSLGHITAAAIALLQGGHARLVGPGLLHEQEFVRAATLRGCVLARSRPIEAWALDRFRTQRDPKLQATLLPLASDRLETSVLLECLQSEEVSLVAAAARAVSSGPARTFVPVIEHLLEHEDLRVREAAVIAALSWGSSRARAACQKQAFAAEPREQMLALWAVLSGPAQHAAIAKLLERDSHRRAALFALGFSGNAGLIPVLLEYLTHDDPITAKLAAQSIALISGLDLRDDAFAVPEAPPLGTGILPETDDEAEAALPPLDVDDLDADLVPPPEYALPVPDAVAIKRAWEQIAPQFDPAKHYLRGALLNFDRLLDALEAAPMRVRSVIAWMLGVRTGGQCWIDPRSLCAVQRDRIAALRARPGRGFARTIG